LFSVTLFRRGPESDTQKSGIGRYGDKAENALVACGARCDKVFFSFSKRDGMFKAIRKALIDPLMRLIDSNGKSDIYHATDELSGIYLPLARGKKVVTFHHITKSNEDLSGYMGYILWKISAALTIRSADVILVASPQTRDEMVKAYKLDPNDIEVLMAEIGEQFKRTEGVKRSKTVGCISSLIHRKNVASLIRAFGKTLEMKDMEDAKLIICGEGSERASLIELTERLKINENVEFVSGLSDDEIVRMYNSVSVSILPSRHEGLGLTVIEAQRCRSPVLYFGDARIPEEVTRYAVPCADEDDMAEKMFRCLSDETYRDGIADAAFRYACEFGEDFGERLIGIYKKLMN
jgi:glycosyltransferase involved in cell wall biosynthesis